jgi:hypothetical protein
MTEENRNLPALREDTGPGGVFSGSVVRFELAQRMARALVAADMVPAQFRNNLGNALVALDMAQRMGMSPMTVMQNLNVIQGRPAWSSQFMIALVNASGLFSPIRYEFRGAEGTDEWACRATARDLRANEPVSGPWVSIKMAKDEGWYGRTGSKWRTMPELMMHYRAGAFFARLYAGHLIMGETREEAEDTIGQRPPIDITPPRTLDPADPDAPPAADPIAAANEQARRRRGRPPRTQPAPEPVVDAVVAPPPPAEPASVTAPEPEAPPPAQPDQAPATEPEFF